MATIVRSSSSSRNNRGGRCVAGRVQLFLVLLCGIVIGMVSMWTCCSLSWPSSFDGELTLLSAADNTARAVVQDDKQTTDTASGGYDDGEGWQPVHVYYGEPLPTTKTFFAQVHQDEAILDLIGNEGYFVDLAANDAQEFSNTLALERAGWDGLCIEPNPTYWYGLSHRKCQVAGALVGATKEKVDVKFRGVYGGIVGRLDEKLANRKREPNAPVEQRFTAPLVQVLQRFHVPPVIDYLSLDVEGAEYLIMKDFPFDKYSIRVMTVERPNKELRQLLEDNDFVFLKDLAWWGETLWSHKSMELSPTHPKVAKIKTEERN